MVGAASAIVIATLSVLCRTLAVIVVCVPLPLDPLR
jgi:hypothetical protein